MAKALSTFDELLSTMRETIDELVDEREEFANSNKSSERVDSLESELSECQYKLEEVEGVQEELDRQFKTEIDAGYGKIIAYSNNLKLHMMMEDFKKTIQQ